MRHIFIALALIVPISVSAQERKLDNTKRAQSEGATLGLGATEAEFRSMQRHYRPKDFNICVKKLRLLRPGMTESEVMETLHAKKVPLKTIDNGVFHDFVVLNDAYFALIALDTRKRLIWASQPIAIGYKIEAPPKKPPKT